MKSLARCRSERAERQLRVRILQPRFLAMRLCEWRSPLLFFYALIYSFICLSPFAWRVLICPSPAPALLRGSWLPRLASSPVHGHTIMMGLRCASWNRRRRSRTHEMKKMRRRNEEENAEPAHPQWDDVQRIFEILLFPPRSLSLRVAMCACCFIFFSQFYLLCQFHEWQLIRCWCCLQSNCDDCWQRRRTRCLLLHFRLFWQ